MKSYNLLLFPLFFVLLACNNDMIPFQKKLPQYIYQGQDYNNDMSQLSSLEDTISFSLGASIASSIKNIPVEISMEKLLSGIRYFSQNPTEEPIFEARLNSLINEKTMALMQEKITKFHGAVMQREGIIKTENGKQVYEIVKSSSDVAPSSYDTVVFRFFVRDVFGDTLQNQLDAEPLRIPVSELETSFPQLTASLKKGSVWRIYQFSGSDDMISQVAVLQLYVDDISAGTSSQTTESDTGTKE